MYTIHSGLIPFYQENFTLNFCWRSFDGQMFLKPVCNVFIAHVPGLYSGQSDGNEDSVSFESACAPGYFLRQKNYRLLIKERDGSSLFGKFKSKKAKKDLTKTSDGVHIYHCNFSIEL